MNRKYAPENNFPKKYIFIFENEYTLREYFEQKSFEHNMPVGEVLFELGEAIDMGAEFQTVDGKKYNFKELTDLIIN